MSEMQINASGQMTLEDGGLREFVPVPVHESRAQPVE